MYPANDEVDCFNQKNVPLENCNTGQNAVIGINT